MVELRPQDAMVEAMFRGWRAQQAARRLREETITAQENLVRRFTERQRRPVAVDPTHIDEWSLWLASEKHRVPSTICGYQ